MTSKPENPDQGPRLIDIRKFLDVVDGVCARPHSYIQPVGFLGVVNFLDGYIIGMSDNRGTKNHPFGNLLTLLENTNGFSHPAWGWPRHYVHLKGNEKLAIKDFPTFLRESFAVPESQVNDLFKRRVQLPRKPPESPQTEYFIRRLE